MHPHRRRKKRPNYGIRTVEVERGPNGFGFTISGQQPCILSCIVANSPADQAGLRAGDFLISVNGLSVSKITHDAVVQLIGNSIGPIKMSIAEYYYSDSSDEELDAGRIVNNRKPKYMHKPRTHRNHHKSEIISPVDISAPSKIKQHKDISPKKNVIKMQHEYISKKPPLDRDPRLFNDNNASTSANISVKPVVQLPIQNENQIEYKAIIGYLGTIEMPKQLLPNSRLQTVCSCIRKLRQEKRTPSAVLMTVLPSCLSLKNSNNQVLAIFPANRVVYISSSSDKESRYFGLVTSAINENSEPARQPPYLWQNYRMDSVKTEDKPTTEIEISNSCHVFITDPKLVDHNIHIKKAESFKITCTPDIITGNCLEFPKSSLYVVSLVQNMYRLQDSSNSNPSNLNHLSKNNPIRLNNIDENSRENHVGPLIANSPQPSASSNSDSGIGFRDDCGNISDRILVVEFPAQRLLPPIVNQQNHRPSAIDGLNIPLDQFDVAEDAAGYSVNNLRSKPFLSPKKSNELIEQNANRKISEFQNYSDQQQKIENKNESFTKLKNPINANEIKKKVNSCEYLNSEEHYRNADVDTGQIFSERPVDVHDLNPNKVYFENSFISVNEEITSKSSMDNISVHSSKSFDLTAIKTIFKTPSTKYLDNKKNFKRAVKLNSCENLAPNNYDDSLLNYKLSPKPFGISKPNHSCEELNNLENDKCGFTSFKDLCSAVSEPDVRIQRNVQSRLDQMMCEDAAPSQTVSSGGPVNWAGSFENLLNDPLGVQVFAEFLKKEFSAENIYFWTSCERFRRLNGAAERASEAQRIYKRHLCVGATEPVNVDSQGRQYAQQALQDAEPKLFEQAQKQIFNLMKFDSYPRFLKSDLYKQCLEGSIEYPSLEVGLLIHPANSTPTKLKKSLSNAEDRRRKSLLPWHRKNRSKSKDRGETEYNQRKDGSESVVSAPTKNGTTAPNTHSSQSSLTSLDLAMSCSMQDCSSSKGSHDDMAPCNINGKPALCRVILNNGATTVVQIRSTETVRQLANRLLDKRGLNYSAYEVHVAGLSKPIDLNEISTSLSGCEVEIEQRVVFKLDLPNRKVISVKSKTTKVLLDVLRPILHKYGYVLDGLHVTIVGTNEVVDVTLPVTSVDGRRLNVQLAEESKTLEIVNNNNQKQKASNQSLDEITNKVFEQLLHEKSETTCAPNTYDRASVKSEDWGSDHSSGIFGRFLRRDSAMHEKKKKTNILRAKGNSTNSSVEDITGEHTAKKPLIAKWKAGVKLQIAATSESDELYEGLKRAQRRLEDQRGTEINFELPEFLKDKENAQSNKLRKIHQNGETSRFYDNEMTIVTKQISEKFSPPVATTRNLKLEIKTQEITESYVSNNNNKLPPISPTKPGMENKISSCPTTPNKGFSSLENSMVENDTTLKHSDDNIQNQNSPKTVEPPPLPPKPKVLPIKPSNWGQNNYFKITREATPKPAERTKPTLYLEQTTSSFV